MILSARAAGAMAAARLMNPTTTRLAPYLPRQVPPQSPYHQQQLQMAGPRPQHRPALAPPYPAADPMPRPQQGPFDVHVESQVHYAQE